MNQNFSDCSQTYQPYLVKGRWSMQG